MGLGSPLFSLQLLHRQFSSSLGSFAWAGLARPVLALPNLTRPRAGAASLPPAAFYWYFYQDGSIGYDIKLTGELSTNLVSPGGEGLAGGGGSVRLNQPALAFPCPLWLARHVSGESCQHPIYSPGCRGGRHQAGVGHAGGAGCQRTGGPD